MKRLLLYLLPISLCLCSRLLAQPAPSLEELERQYSHAHPEVMFNFPAFRINHRHYVIFPRHEEMAVNLISPSGYNLLGNLDSIIKVFSKDVEFYKDSVPNGGNVRIDYLLSDEYPKLIRFKKYAPCNDLFVQQKGGLSYLKTRQDTVRLIIKKEYSGDEAMHNRYKVIPWVEVTFCLNNFFDIDSLTGKNGMLANIIDTLHKTAIADSVKYKSNITSVLYYQPFSENKVTKTFTMKQYPVEGFPSVVEEKKRMNKFVVNASIGGGIVRNTFAPMFDIGIELQHAYRYWADDKFKNNYNIFRISATPYYFFDKDEKGNFIMNDNWFVNVALGSVYGNAENTWLGKEVTIGAGYLAVEKGGYFRGITGKVFTNIMLVDKTLTIVPEIIFTNNFTQFFPGITLKVF